MTKIVCPDTGSQMTVGSITFAPSVPSGNTACPPDLAAMLDKARLHVMTPKERYEQKVSWLQGMSGKLADPMPSREQIVKALAEMGVMDPEPGDSIRGRAD